MFSEIPNLKHQVSVLGIIHSDCIAGVLANAKIMKINHFHKVWKTLVGMQSDLNGNLSKPNPIKFEKVNNEDTMQYINRRVKEG